MKKMGHSSSILWKREAMILKRTNSSSTLREENEYGVNVKVPDSTNNWLTDHDYP